MIGRLRGQLVWKRAPLLLIDVHGVGYEVEAPMSTFYRLPAPGSDVEVFTHLHVREDAQLLFGFATEAERALFRELTKVSGVGAKLALTILSGMSIDDFARCVQDQDAASLMRLPGVGRKSAERLIIEMRDRLKAREVAIEPQNAAGEAFHPEVRATHDAISALVALGYKPQDANRMVQSVNVAGLAGEEIIRRALKSALR